MNIAAGSPIEKGKDIEDTTPKEYIEKLMAEKFSGYISVSTMGKYGLEEGTIIFHNGEIVSSDYEYYKFNKVFKAEQGLERTVNSMLSKKGILDSFSLTSYQVQLILTLNEECNLTQKITKETLKIPKEFQQKYEEELASELPTSDMSKTQLFKKLGLSEEAGKKSTKETLINKAKTENNETEKIVEEKSNNVNKLRNLLFK